MSRLKNILIGTGLKERYSYLTKREKNILNLYYLEGYKDEEIAIFYGFSRQAINYIRKKAINKLKVF